jgi:hypothetical protein
MKINLALMVAASTLVLAGCAAMQEGSKPDSNKSAIESVLAQRARLKAQDGGIGLLSEQHVKELRAINVQSCPANFRSAWFNYLVEVQNLHTRMERVAIVASGTGKEVADLPTLIKFAATNPTLGHYLLSALDKVDDAWAKLDRTAMNYGVMPER